MSTTDPHTMRIARLKDLAAQLGVIVNARVMDILITSSTQETQIIVHMHTPQLDQKV